jgi:hypothetical protein
MSRRSRAVLPLAALLGLAGLALAKPPDLPLDHKDTVMPQAAPPEAAEQIQLEPDGPPRPTRGPDGEAELRQMQRQESLPAAAKVREFFHGGAFWHIPSLRARRALAANVLFAVHPLLSLADLVDLVDLPTDHPAPASVDEQAGEIHEDAERPTPEDSRCPYLQRQSQEMKANTPPDPLVPGDVLTNLENLRQAGEFVRQAEALRDAGRRDEAADCCRRAGRLCPGSRCQARADQLLGELSGEARARDPLVDPETFGLIEPVPAAAQPFPPAETKPAARLIAVEEGGAAGEEEQEPPGTPRAVAKPLAFARATRVAHTARLLNVDSAEAEWTAGGLRLLWRFQAGNWVVTFCWDRGNLTVSRTPLIYRGGIE